VTKLVPSRPITELLAHVFAVAFADDVAQVRIALEGVGVLVRVA
jgi:hypothetical protein